MIYDEMPAVNSLEASALVAVPLHFIMLLISSALETRDPVSRQIM